MAKDKGFHAIARGRVQGVGFRDFVARNANSLGLKGCVCNLPDGCSVAVAAEGGREDLDELLGRIRQGPPSAEVQGVDVQWTEASGGYEDFRLVYRTPADWAWVSGG